MLYKLCFIDEYCEQYPSVPGVCRDGCLPGEVRSVIDAENNGCLNSIIAGFIPDCCRKVIKLSVLTDKDWTSSSTFKIGHPSDHAFDVTMKTKWMPVQRAPLPQWVQVTEYSN